MIFIYIFSVVFGYILGIFLAYSFRNKTHAPNSKFICKMKYERDNKCYKLKPIITSCGIPL